MKTILAALILLGYLSTLVVSSWHLSEWYGLSRGSLPNWLSFALAVTLEGNAFILSLLSNSLLRRSLWAHGGSLAALGLVWIGNFVSMSRAAPELSKVEVFIASMFVPVGTYVMAKVLGELLQLDRGSAPKRFRSSGPANSTVAALELREPLSLENMVLDALTERPLRTRDLGAIMPPELREELPEALRRLEVAGTIRKEGPFWVRVAVGDKDEKASA